MSTLVCFAVKEEAAAFRRTPAAASVQIMLVGMGKANAEASIRNFLAGGASVPASRPSLVITSGFVGGLNPQLITGDAVFSTDPEQERWGETPVEPGSATVSQPDGSRGRSPHQSLKTRLLALGAREAKFHCADRVAVTVAEKAALWRATGADAVEMESQIIRDICREQKIPSATVRVILDPAGEDLPLDFNALLTPDMKMDSGKLALAILKSPGKIPSLLRLQRQTRLAAQKLAQVLETVI
jgi:adenosylhomocysteine nucleosidase